ncbi:MAG: hypothetical protein AB4352_03010 [Hormoscilla sp.]
MKSNQVVLSGIIALTTTIAVSLPVQSQYGNNCPVTYAQVQEAIRIAAKEDGLYSVSQLRSFPRRSQRLVVQLQSIYKDYRCRNIQQQVEQSLRYFWEATIRAEYQMRISLLELNLAKIGIPPGERNRIEGEIYRIRNEEMPMAIQRRIGGFFGTSNY